MDLPKRKPNRLRGYDYGQNGGYFLTLCTNRKEKILSKIVGEGSPLPNEESVYFVSLTVYGQIVDKHIGMMIDRYPEIKVDNYVIIPNHIHILAVVDKGPFGTGDPSPTIELAMGWIKCQTTKQINILRNTPYQKVWQRSFHDHIIRGQQDYYEILQYIEENPLRWKMDCFY